MGPSSCKTLCRVLRASVYKVDTRQTVLFFMKPGENHTAVLHMLPILLLELRGIVGRISKAAVCWPCLMFSGQRRISREELKHSELCEELKAGTPVSCVKTQLFVDTFWPEGVAPLLYRPAIQAAGLA